MAKSVVTDVWGGAKQVVSGWWHHRHPPEQADAGPSAQPTPLPASTNQTTNVHQTAHVTGDGNTTFLVGGNLTQSPNP